MKIVYFNYMYDLQGVSLGSYIKAKELMSELANVGHEVKIFWIKNQPGRKNGENAVSRNFLKKKLSIFLHDPKQFLMNVKYFIKEYKILQREKPDLIIARLELYLFSAVLLARLKGIPIIVEAEAPCVYEARKFHPEYWYVPKLAEAIERMNLHYSNSNFCVSNQARDYFIRRGLATEKMSVITNGADLDKFSMTNGKAGPRQGFGLTNKTVIGFVGSFHFWHGVDNLTKLIKKAMALDEKIAFMLVGSGGPMKSALEQFIKEEDFGARVVLTGYVPYEDIPNYMSAMDIVLAPYPNLEFFYYSPIKIFEYMACGKPLVTTNIGQMSEIIEDGYNGLLCEPDNVDEMFQKIASLVSNHDLRTRLGQNARKSVVEKHTWRKKAEKLSLICSEVVQQTMETSK